jgi:hypothetical protein
VAEYLKEINFLKTLEHTDTEKNKVIEHQANYSALKEALYVAMAGDSKTIYGRMSRKLYRKSL